MEDKINKIWYQMNMKEITSEQARQQVLDLFAVSGRSELLVSFLQWYVKDEAQRENKELITSIVERYLNENQPSCLGAVSFQLFQELYGSYVQMDDRFESVHIWSEELALRNKGRWTPILISKAKYEAEKLHSWNN